MKLIRELEEEGGKEAGNIPESILKAAGCKQN